ncbi:uncharacterized protein LOC113468846 [Diaphorina citri]|uniref:Uncharacterized protein LOC113468846 n=1 Tax=Diaphorina citri TaxID=121845 RepID=A0A3Q0J078_DIACI|nr:uncharacterized protein LOC113468846 [Diaphorina citri]
MYVKQHQKPGMSDEEGEMLKKIKLLGMHVLLNIKFDQEEVINILEMIKDSASVQPKADDDEKSDVESKSDHETKVDEIDVEGLVKYCSRLVQTLESQYPNAWDGFIYKYTTERDSNLSEIQRRVLTLNIDQSSHAEVYLKLTDSKALLRAETVKYLILLWLKMSMIKSFKKTLRKLRLSA